MSAEAKDDKPMLASLVMAGESQKDAIAITDFVFMANDVSNAYLVTTGDGDVMVNIGFIPSVERNKALFAPHRTGPLRYIVLTQAHPDHYGGVPGFKEPGTKVIAHRNFVDTWTFFDNLGPYIDRRSGKLWASTTRTGGTPIIPPKVVPDIEFDEQYGFDLGGRRFELISTPGGESLCAISVWMPKEKIAFTGNLFGPVFLSMPNFTTVRGDRPRLIQRFLRSLEKVRDLGAELLITGHGEPVHGAAKIKAALDKIHAAVSYVEKETLAGMNAGKDVHTLMREIKLPDELKIGEFHGKTAWTVRAVWEENSGWFHYDSTTSLYGVPRSSIDKDLAELAGGASKLAERARTKLDDGHPLEAVHLTDIALGAEPQNKDALRVKKDAHQRLLELSGGSNLSEVMWLKSEIAAAEAALAS
jgi:alkyl sulfatase BDS1-like metallo-beta-lactamase superfamily hydrolase